MVSITGFGSVFEFNADRNRALPMVGFNKLCFFVVFKRVRVLKNKRPGGGVTEPKNERMVGG